MNLAVLAVTWAIIVVVNGYSTGPPASICTGMFPDAVQHGASPQVNDPLTTPFRVSANKDSFQPNDAVIFTLYAVQSSVQFRGFAVTVRSQATSLSVGTIQLFGSSVPHQIICDGTVATHTDASDKMYVTFIWLAPSETIGSVDVIATVVDNKITYWAEDTIWAFKDSSTTTTSTTTTSTTTTTPTTTTQAIMTMPPSTSAPTTSPEELVPGSTCPRRENLPYEYEYLDIRSNGTLPSTCFTDKYTLLSNHLVDPSIRWVQCKVYGNALEKDINVNNFEPIPTDLEVSLEGYASTVSQSTCLSFVAVVGLVHTKIWQCGALTTMSSLNTSERYSFLINIVNNGLGKSDYCVQIRFRNIIPNRCIYVQCEAKQ